MKKKLSEGGRFDEHCVRKPGIDEDSWGYKPFERDEGRNEGDDCMF